MTSSPGALPLDESLRVVRRTELVPSDRPHEPASAAPVDTPVPAAAASTDAACGSPTEAVAGCLDAIGTDARWHAWAFVDAEGALRRAEEATAALAAGRPRRRLEGVPIGVKDVIDVAKMPCRAGFAPFTDRVPDVSAAAVQRLVAQGAVVVGKTVTTQFAFSDPTPAVNPWHPARTPGGSSSGSAVAVALGQVPVALGTQTSGSTIRPAAYTGIVGFKPSRGRVPTTGILPLAWTLDEVGILARTVATCAAVFEALASAAPAPAPVRARGLRIGLLEDACELASPEVVDGVAATARVLAGLGAEVVPLRLNLLGAVAAAHKVIMAAEIGAVHARLYDRHPADYEPLIASAVSEAGEVTGADYLDAQRIRRRLGDDAAASFADVDLWLLPSVVDVAPGRETTGDRSLQLAASLLGLPAVSIPAGLGREGLPVGAQLVGARNDDAQVLLVAAAVTGAESWPGRGLTPPGSDTAGAGGPR